MIILTKPSNIVPQTSSGMGKYDSLCDGRIFESAKPIQVTSHLIADFCAAIGETNPLYTDPEAASVGPDGGLAAPPSLAAILGDDDAGVRCLDFARDLGLDLARQVQHDADPCERRTQEQRTRRIQPRNEQGRDVAHPRRERDSHEAGEAEKDSRDQRKDRNSRKV